jgi:CrcB protein
MIWLVAGGSAAGGVCRYLLAGLLQPRTPAAFPLGTFVVNLSGAVAVGFVIRWALATPTVTPEMRVLLTTGFLGGYTTFSAFSYESIALIEAGEPRRAVLYVVGSVVLSLIGTVLGIGVADWIIARR